MVPLSLKRVWRYQRGNQNPYIEEEQTTQWPKEKVQKDKQRSTKHTYKTKDRVTRTPLKTGGELRCSRKVSSSCSTSDTRRVNLVTNPVNKWNPFYCLNNKISLNHFMQIDNNWFVNILDQKNKRSFVRQGQLSKRNNAMFNFTLELKESDFRCNKIENYFHIVWVGGLCILVVYYISAYRTLWSREQA